MYLERIITLASSTADTPHQEKPRCSPRHVDHYARCPGDRPRHPTGTRPPRAGRVQDTVRPVLGQQRPGRAGAHSARADRLHQLAWAVLRSTCTSDHRWSGAERTMLLWVCLPLYLIGAVVTAVVHAGNSRATRKNPLFLHFGRQLRTLWGALVRLPAAPGHSECDLRVRQCQCDLAVVLVGGTVIRVAPHLYDVVRARRYVPSVSSSYVYASLRDGVAWDVVRRWR